MRVYNVSAEAVALAPVVIDADDTVNGPTITRGGASNFHDLTLVVVTGAITDGTHTLTIEDSPDDTAWSAVADAKLVGGTNGFELAADSVYSRAYAGSQPYVRVSVETAGATVGGLFAALAIQTNPRKTPTR